jgi:hypothetical protein
MVSSRKLSDILEAVITTKDQIFRYGKSGENMFDSVVYSNKGKLNFTKFNGILKRFDLRV